MVRRGNFTFYICLNWPHDFSFINDRLEHYGTLWNTMGSDPIVHAFINDRLEHYGTLWNTMGSDPIVHARFVSRAGWGTLWGLTP